MAKDETQREVTPEDGRGLCVSNLRVHAGKYEYWSLDEKIVDDVHRVMVEVKSSTKPCSPTPPQATPRHATPRHAPRHAMPRHATPRHATPRHATPRLCNSFCLKGIHILSPPLGEAGHEHEEVCGWFSVKEPETEEVVLTLVRT